ncbi:MAG: hypothetical protein GXO86_08905 [Chlorobi bacterium]|nr:hypothetical protein [Chlorobiota bacterium]
MDKYITLREFANFHEISVTLIREFADFGLIEVRQIKNKPCIHIDDMERCERVIRLHKELGVNKEGIEIILEMRRRLEEMQKEITRMKHVLNKYENRIANLFPEEFFDVE